MYLYLITLLPVLLACIAPSTAVTHEELQELQTVCESLDSCTTRRTVDSLDRYPCHCSSDCYKYQTCCVDARSRNRRPPNQVPSCRPISESRAYFIFDSCSASGDSAFERLCQEETVGGDLMSKVPVTSLSTNKTYRNYFCFKCNEDTEDFVFWNLRMNSSESFAGETNDVALEYDGDSGTWLAAVGDGGASVPVRMLVEIPSQIYSLPKICIPGAVANCSARYRGKDNRKKCNKYTTYIYFLKGEEGKTLYRNPHCALCNFESLENMACGVQTVFRASEKRPFSFVLLLDINPRDGDRVGMVRLCGEENQVWDPYFKKCRTLTCAMPRYKIRDGRCVPP